MCLQEAAELAALQERQKLGNQQTVAELKSMVEVLERESQTNRITAAKRRTLLAEVEEAKSGARAAIGSHEVRTICHLDEAFVQAGRQAIRLCSQYGGWFRGWDVSLCGGGQ